MSNEEQIEYLQALVMHLDWWGLPNVTIGKHLQLFVDIAAELRQFIPSRLAQCLTNTDVRREALAEIDKLRSRMIETQIEYLQTYITLLDWWILPSVDYLSNIDFVSGATTELEDLLPAYISEPNYFHERHTLALDELDKLRSIKYNSSAL